MREIPPFTAGAENNDPAVDEAAARADGFESAWPIHEGRAKGLYFYLEATRKYGEGCRVHVDGRGEMQMFGGYSYLGLNQHPDINAAAIAAIETYGTGTHGVRLLAGTLPIHRSLEARVAEFLGTEAAVTFSSGYLANLSTISCLVGPDDTVICDQLDHMSILDGCQLSRANFARFRHNDIKHLELCLQRCGEGGRKLVIVDGVFSMDGDIADVPGISRMCKKYDALLMVDEAHSIGVLGRKGRGIQEHFDLEAGMIDLKMGTFSKAIPTMGGYIATSSEICEFLSHQARGFIFSGALSPPAAAAAEAALNVIDAEPERIERLQENVRYFADRLRSAGFTVHGGQTPIFPIICGPQWKAFEFAQYCRDAGIYVQAIPDPVVPKGTSRLRVAVSYDHEVSDLDTCVDVLRDGAIAIQGISDYCG